MKDPRRQVASSPGRPRLLVVGSTFPAGDDGTPAFVADLAQVEATAFDTTVLVPAVPGGRIREHRDGYDVRRYRFFPQPWEDLAHGAILDNLRARPSRWLQVPFLFACGVVALRRAVRELAPDVLHVHWIVPQGVLALLAARRVPWLVSTHGADLYALTSSPFRVLKRLVLRRAAVVTVMNEDMRSLVIGLGIDGDKVRMLPMGVHIERIPAAERDAVERLPGSILFVGRLVEKKGVQVLLSALAGLPRELDWTLDIVGDGPMRAELEHMAAPYGDRVVFHGQQPRHQVRRLLRRSSIAAFPSVRARSGDQDGRPVALLEAMASGVAVVVTDLPGLGETVRGGERAGVVVPAGDDSALAAALTRLLGDEDLRRRLALSAAALVADYSTEAVGAQYAALLLQAAARPTLGPELHQ